MSDSIEHLKEHIRGLEMALETAETEGERQYIRNIIRQYEAEIRKQETERDS